jgi:hypothetical protein
MRRAHAPGAGPVPSLVSEWFVMGDDQEPAGQKRIEDGRCAVGVGGRTTTTGPAEIGDDLTVAAAADSDAASVVEAAGHFRIYLGAAAGVGKTYAMLSEGQRRRGRGADVVIGFVESRAPGRTRSAGRTCWTSWLPGST